VWRWGKRAGGGWREGRQCGERGEVEPSQGNDQKQHSGHNVEDDEQQVHDNYAARFTIAEPARQTGHRNERHE